MGRSTVHRLESSSVRLLEKLKVFPLLNEPDERLETFNSVCSGTYLRSFLQYSCVINIHIASPKGSVGDVSVQIGLLN